MRQVLRKLSVIEKARVYVNAALSGLNSFASVFKVSVGEVEIGVAPTPGSADGGNLEFDLTEMFILIGKAARAAQRGWVSLIDEVRYHKEDELAAIIAAVHRVSQKISRSLSLPPACLKSQYWRGTLNRILSGFLIIRVLAHLALLLRIPPFAILLKMRALKFSTRHFPKLLK